jgi:hypothetical protein
MTFSILMAYYALVFIITTCPALRDYRIITLAN